MSYLPYIFARNSVFYGREELFLVGMFTMGFLILSIGKTWDFRRFKKCKGGQKWGLPQWFCFGHNNLLFTREDKIKKVKQRQNFLSLLLFIWVVLGIVLLATR